MPKGSKSSYSSKQKRQAHHIEQSEKKRGRSQKDAERIGIKPPSQFAHTLLHFCVLVPTHPMFVAC